MKDNNTKSILVSIELTEEKIIQFYTLFYDYYNSIYIQPSSPSIKYVPKGESITLYVSNLYNNYIIFNHLEGNGEIYLEGKNQLYFLNNINNNLTLTFDDIGKDMIEIIVKEVNETNNSKGFIFYLEQYLLYNTSIVEEDTNDRKNKTTLIIIIIACVVIIIILAGFIVAFVCYNKKKKMSGDISKISFERGRESNLLIVDDEN